MGLALDRVPTNDRLPRCETCRFYSRNGLPWMGFTRACVACFHYVTWDSELGISISTPANGIPDVVSSNAHAHISEVVLASCKLYKFSSAVHMYGGRYHHKTTPLVSDFSMRLIWLESTSYNGKQFTRNSHRDQLRLLMKTRNSFFVSNYSKRDYVNIWAFSSKE